MHPPDSIGSSAGASEHIRVLALTKYGRRAASSRYRFFDYIPLLTRQGVSVTSVSLFSDAYVERLFAGRPVDYSDVALGFLRRLIAISSAPRFDVLWIEGELFPRLPALVERLLGLFGCRYVVDLDDAIFHTYDLHPWPLVRTLLGRKMDVVLRDATAVVAGNNYLAGRALRAGASRVVVVPTTVDDRAYARVERLAGDRLTFGWIGSPSTEHYLRTIQAELQQLCQSLPASLRLIGLAAGGPSGVDVVRRPWSEQSEIEELAACDIGLAPLFDGPWERGKCGLKAIQYMAAGLPVLAARIGILPDVVVHGETGFLYGDGAEFTRFARQLAGDPELRARMGQAGRLRAATHYSIHRWAEKVGDVLLTSAKR